jgi:hypothetical protein
MSDEIVAVSLGERGYHFALTALQVPASRAIGVARSVSITTAAVRALSLFLALLIIGNSVFALWQTSHIALRLRDGWWWGFWITIVVGIIITLTQGWVNQRSEAERRQNLQLHKGVNALLQAATASDSKLAPLQLVSGTDDSSPEPIILGPCGALTLTPEYYFAVLA